MTAKIIAPRADDLTPDGGLAIPLRTGGSIRLDMPVDVVHSHAPAPPPKTVWNTDPSVTITQPLLRGAGLYVNSQGIRIAFYEYQRTKALTTLEVTRVLSDTERAYWRLFAAREELKVRKTEYDSAVAQLQRARRQVQAGVGKEVDVIRADSEFVIRYMNDASKRTLAKLARLLPCKVEEIVGKSIDIFHKDPANQRRILSDPKNLPHQANIQLGPETLSLLVTPIFDANRKHIGAMVTWDVVTEKLRLEAANLDFTGQIAAISKAQPVTQYDMDGMILEVNEQFEKLLGWSRDELIGKHVSMFVNEKTRQSAEYRAAIKDQWDRLRSGEVCSGQGCRTTKPGKDIWIQYSYLSLIHI